MLNNWIDKKTGQKIDPLKFFVPTKIFACKYDKIVPTSSSLALYNKLPNAEISILDSGHIGYLIQNSLF